MEKQWAADSWQTLYANLLLIGYAYQAETFLIHGKNGEALERYQKSFATAEKLASQDAADLESRRSMAKVHAALAVAYARGEQKGQAALEFQKSLQGARSLLQMRPEDAEAAYIAGEADRGRTAISA